MFFYLHSESPHSTFNNYLQPQIQTKTTLAMKSFNSSQDIIDFAIKGEEQAVSFYNQLAEQASSSAMKKVFLGFAKEEEGHKERLENVNTSKFTFKDSAPITDLHIADYINPSIKLSGLNYGEALVIAMNREKRAFMLYTKLAKMVNDPALKELFQFLAKEEAKHKLRFEEEFDDQLLDN